MAVACPALPGIRQLTATLETEEQVLKRLDGQTGRQENLRPRGNSLWSSVSTVAYCQGPVALKLAQQSS